MLVWIASIRRAISLTYIRGALGFSLLKPFQLFHVDFQVQFAIQECRLHIHLMNFQVHVRSKCKYYLNCIEFGHDNNYFAKSTPSTCKHPLATNLILKRTTMLLAFFFVRKTHLHFMALRPFGNEVNSHMPLAIRNSYSSCIANSHPLVSLDLIVFFSNF